ncbi:MFS transporter [Neisseria meningitidis]|nr:MFS transporter [Neisseria meningitidis]MBH6257095.1 MFS transporter [Neisseria meningitidis]MBH6511205.1 MFS transporter [Neisseria meningitidis]
MEKNTLSARAPSPWLPLLLAIAIFMQMLDATILNTALPEIAVDLNESPLDMQLAVVAYTLTVALLIPLSGYLADRFGTKKVFFGSIAVFMLGSALCAASGSLFELTLSRVVQGIGGSMLVPIPRLTILRVYDKSKLLNAINYAVMPALIGPVLGPLAGGYLVEYASWHWIFLLNLPIGLLGFILGRNIMPDVKGNDTALDFKGYLIFSAAACLLLLSAESLSHALPPYFALLPLCGGLLFARRYFRHMKTASKPIYSADLFLIRTFRLGLAGNLFSRLGISSIPFLMPLMFQVAFGFGASLSGWLVAPVALSSLLVKPLIAPLMKRFGYRTVLLWNTKLLAAFIMLLAAFIMLLAAFIMLLALPDGNSPLWIWIFLSLAIGACNSLQFSAMNTLTLADLRPQQTGSGNSLMAVNQQLAISMGIVAGALILKNWTFLIPASSGLHSAFRMTLLSIGSITLASSLVFKRLHVSDGANLTRNTPS